MGMQFTEDPNCSTKTTDGGDNGKDMASKYCKAAGGDMSKVDKWFGFDTVTDYDKSGDGGIVKRGTIKITDNTGDIDTK